CRVTRRPRRLNINDETLDASVTVRDGENLTSAFLEEPRDPVKPRVPIERDDSQPAERGGGDAVRGEMPDGRDVHSRPELLNQARRREPIELRLGAAEQAQAADRRRQHVDALRADPHTLADLERRALGIARAPRRLERERRPWREGARERRAPIDLDAHPLEHADELELSDHAVP